MPPFVVGIILLSAAMHAGWNVLVRRQRATDLFVRISLVIAVVGLVPTLAAEFFSTPVLPVIWTIVPLAASAQAFYYLGLSRGYRSGDFTIVYPLVRAIPVLLVALADLALGHPPSLLGWLGLFLVSAGCVLIPLESLRGLTIKRYWNRTSLWIVIAALGTVGYTAVDSIAAQALQGGPLAAIRYNVYESSIAFITYSLLLRAVGDTIVYEPGWKGWRTPSVAAFFLFAAYSMVLWAYQLTPHASYVVALRQVSIVLGVIVGAFLFREPAPLLRFGAAALIAAGIVAIALAG